MLARDVLACLKEDASDLEKAMRWHQEKTPSISGIWPADQCSGGGPANTVLPADAPLGAMLTLPAGTVLRAEVRNASGVVIYPRGTLLRQSTALPVGTVLGAGNRFASSISLRPMIWPKNVPLPDVLILNGAP